MLHSNDSIDSVVVTEESFVVGGGGSNPSIALFFLTVFYLIFFHFFFFLLLHFVLISYSKIFPKASKSNRCGGRPGVGEGHNHLQQHWYIGDNDSGYEYFSGDTTEISSETEAGLQLGLQMHTVPNVEI